MMLSLPVMLILFRVLVLKDQFLVLVLVSLFFVSVLVLEGLAFVLVLDLASPVLEKSLLEDLKILNRLHAHY